MRTQASICPKLHLFVCVNRRDASDPLGEGCGARGDAVYDALKGEVARRGDFRNTWVTKTHCLGICPKRGCTVAEYPKGIVWREVGREDVPAFVAPMVGSEGLATTTRASFDSTLEHMETLQANKVIELARRLHPGITAEDIRNPHDFPNLEDLDWHYEDGILTGIQSVVTALRAMDRQGGGGGGDTSQENEP
jgi:(2Fe-2S) ferredoxin